MFLEKSRCKLCDMFSADCSSVQPILPPPLPLPPGFAFSHALLTSPQLRDMMVAYLLRGEMIISNDKYEMTEISNSYYSVQMSLTIRRLDKSDLGGYKCISKNSIGDAEGNIRLYEMELPKRSKSELGDEEELLEPGQHLPTGQQGSLREADGAESGGEAGRGGVLNGDQSSGHLNHERIHFSIKVLLGLLALFVAL